MMKNVFYFTLKILFVLKIFKFSPENGLIKKIRLIPKFMTSRHGKRRIAIHILLNILRYKGNQTMKFGQLIEYDMRNNYISCVQFVVIIWQV